MWIIRRFEGAFFYFPFLILALLLKLPFRLKCRNCGKPLLFDWIASRQGYCRSCCLEDRHILEGYYVRPNSFIYEKVIQQVGDGLVLDAGCGAGHIVEKLHKDGSRKCIGIDFSKEGLKQAASRCSQAAFTLGDVAHLPFKNNVFDWIISVEVLEHVPDMRLATKEYYRVLSQGGWVLLTIPNGKGLTSRDDPGHINFLGFNQLVQLVRESGFEIGHAEKFGIELPVVSYLARAISSNIGKRIPFADPLNLQVPETLSTNFLIVAQKPLLRSGEIQ
jgi:ubiquinone/menaquinone biosynthesis C-methylase UbiE